MDKNIKIQTAIASVPESQTVVITTIVTGADERTVNAIFELAQSMMGKLEDAGATVNSVLAG